MDLLLTQLKCSVRYQPNPQACCRSEPKSSQNCADMTLNIAHMLHRTTCWGLSIGKESGRVPIRPIKNFSKGRRWCLLLAARGTTNSPLSVTFSQYQVPICSQPHARNNCSCTNAKYLGLLVTHTTMIVPLGLASCLMGNESNS